MRFKFIISLIIPLLLIFGLHFLSNYLFLFPAIKENIIHEKKILLKELTQMALNTIENCNAVNNTLLSEDELKTLALEQMRKLNYGTNQKSYFWITDLSPKMLMHPYRQDLEGKLLSDYRDMKGTALFNNAVNMVTQNGEGYLEYYWQYQDDSTKYLPKITFVKSYDKWGWVIGTGIYIDDIELELDKLRYNELRSTGLITLLLLVLLTSIVLFGIKSEKHRRDVQHRLKLSEEKFRKIFHDSNDIILMSNLDGLILDINKKTLTTYGLKYEDIVGKKTFEMIPEKYHGEIRERLSHIGQKNLEPLEIELAPNNNIHMSVEIKSSLSVYEDKPVVLSIMRDVTVRKEHEKKLLESHLHYKIVADYTCDWEYWLSTTGEFKYISPSCKRICGYDPDAFRSDHTLYTNIIIPEDQEKWKTHHTNAFEHHVGNEVIEFRILHKLGHEVWIEHSCQPVYDGHNNYMGARGNNRDISIRKKAEERLINAHKNLETSEAKFKKLSNLTFEGIAIHDKGEVIDVNRSLLNMFGYTREELIDKYALDILFDQQSQQTLISNITNNVNKPYEVTGIKKDGSKFPVEVEGKTYFTEESGKTLRATALRDITARKQAESEIRKLSKAVEQSANLVLITDTKGIIEYANEKFYTTTGFTRDEVIGNTPRILKSGKQDQLFYKDLWKTIRAGKVWKGELCNKKKNGDLYWESTLITPVLNDNHEITNFMSVKEDITDIKLADLKIFNAIIETEEKERKKFAEDLHDELGPHLSGIRLYINELEDESIKPQRRNSIVATLDVLVKEAIDKTRTISNLLMPSILTDYGLIKALESFCSRINATKKISIHLTDSHKELSFNKITEIVVYRVITELINNTLKHAEAKNISIDFIKKGLNLELYYTDDGRGFDIENELKQKNGLGLNNVINRIKSIEGNYHFESIPEKGVTFKFMIPQIELNE